MTDFLTIFRPRGLLHMRCTLLAPLVKRWSLGLLTTMTLLAGATASRADILFTEYGSNGSLSAVKRVTDAGAPVWTRTVNLDGPTGIVTDSSGNVYVANTGRALGSGPFNSTILKYNSAGTLTNTFNLTLNSAPLGLAIGPDGFLYASATNGTPPPPGQLATATNQIFRINPNNGTFATWSTAGPGGPVPTIQFPVPTAPLNYAGIAFDSSGRLYVADYFRNRIDRYDTNGAYLGVFTANAQLDGPYGLAFDRFGNLIVSNSSKLVVNPVDKILAFDSNGNFITTLQNQFPTLYLPAGIAFDNSGNLLVANNAASLNGQGSIVKLQINYTGSTPTGTTNLGAVLTGLNGPVFLAVPEPASVILAGIGVVGVLTIGVRLRRKAADA